MQCNGEAEASRFLDENMAEGDLGDGTENRLAAAAAPPSLQTRPPAQGPPSRAEVRRVESRASDVAFSWTAFTMPHTTLKPISVSLVDLSKEELRERLQEATETLEMLRCELEVTHRYLEGKYEALKILQGKTILDKATTHTKSLLQKSEERAKALEKEVNGLQWELTFNQVQLKKFEQLWEQKLDRTSSENKVLSKSLDERLMEVRELKAENTVLGQQCVELLSMLSAKEQKVYEGTKPPASHGREGCVLQMAVLGACRCPGAMESCSCARTAAASRMQVLQLRQELELLSRSREEALLMADAFRIAFEQQLRKRSEHLLMLAETRSLKSYPSSTLGVNRTSVAQKLRAILPSGLEAEAPLEHTATLQRLLDLLNDKEEALAHQRKVSRMLAHHADELQKQLPVEAAWTLDSSSKPLEPFNFYSRPLGNSQLKTSLWRSQSDLKNKRHQLHNSKIYSQGLLDSQSQKRESSGIKTQRLEPPNTKTQTVEPQVTNTQRVEPPVTKTQTVEAPVTKTQTVEPQVTKTQTVETPVTKTQTVEAPVTKTQTVEPPITKTQTVEPSGTKTQTIEPPVIKTQTVEPPVAKTQTVEPPDLKTQRVEPPVTKTQTVEPPVTKTQIVEPPVTKTQTVELSVTKTLTVELLGTKSQTVEPPDLKTQRLEPPVTKTQIVEPPVTKTQADEPPDSKTQTVEPSATKTQTIEPPVIKTQTVEPPVTKTQIVEPPVTKTQADEPPDSKTQTVEPSATKTQTIEPPVIKTQTVEPPVAKTQTVEPPVTKTQIVEPPVTKTQTVEPPGTKTQTIEPPDTKTQTVEPPVTKTQADEPPDSKTQTVEPSGTKTQTIEPPVIKTQAVEPPDTKAQPEVPPDVKTQPEELPGTKTQAEELQETNSLLMEPSDIEEPPNANTRVPEALDSSQSPERTEAKTQRTQ